MLTPGLDTSDLIDVTFTRDDLCLILDCLQKKGWRPEVDPIVLYIQDQLE